MPSRIKDSSSSYLRQLAKCPIKWNEWGDELVLNARAQSKALFLTIGSAADPWCQKMINECFLDDAIVDFLSREFFCIAVDRDERPDLAESYLYYIKGIRARGGWPLSLWLTPDFNPFYGGSYYQIKDGEEGPGFKTVLKRIRDGWAEDQAAVRVEANRVRENLLRHQAQIPLGNSVPDLIAPAGSAYESGFNYLFENFDSQDGGFGGAPKFARWPALNFLLRCAVIQGVNSEDGIQAIEMVSDSLKKIVRSGIFDHVAGGVFKYSFDDRWRFPAFEKLPSDQANFVLTLLECAAFTGNRRFQSVAFFSLEAALRDLSQRLVESSLSAKVGVETEGVQAGESFEKYYCWTMVEIDELLGDEGALFCEFWGVTERGNIPEEYDNKKLMTGYCVLYQTDTLSEFAVRRNCSEEEVSALMDSGLERLRQARDKRTNRRGETRFFTNSNGGLIGALARAARVSDVDSREFSKFLNAGIKLAEFIESRLWNDHTQSLSHVFANGRASGVGFAEDYAALVSGLIELYDATFAPRWLKLAVEVQRAMDVRFWDGIGGGYFRSAADDRSVFLRLKDCFDGNDPSANSQAALNLFRLGAMLNDFSFRERGFRVLQAFRELWEKTPWNHAYLLLSLEWALTPPVRILVWGDLSFAGKAGGMALEFRDRRRSPFVLLRADLLADDESPALAGVVPRGNVERGREGEAHIYRGEMRLGIARTATELKELLLFGGE